MSTMSDLINLQTPQHVAAAACLYVLMSEHNDDERGGNSTGD
jgi:hypothetical protein